VFAGATAVAASDASAAGLASRAQAIEDKLTSAFGAGVSGFLVYDYYPFWETPGPEFDARPEEPLAGSGGVLARHAPDNR
jgi:hypothetical protein